MLGCLVTMTCDDVIFRPDEATELIWSRKIFLLRGIMTLAINIHKEMTPSRIFAQLSVWRILHAAICIKWLCVAYGSGFHVGVLDGTSGDTSDV